MWSRRSRIRQHAEASTWWCPAALATKAPAELSLREADWFPVPVMAQHEAMGPNLGGQSQSDENNFDHDQCYREGLHVKSKAGRQWCREYGPASRSGRDYAGRATSRTAEKYLPGSTEFGDVDSDAAEQRSRRTQAAEQYRPDRIRLLLIAEAPPADPNRYFYFHEVNAHDSLFRHVARSLLGVEPTRENKPELLAQLQQQGTFLIDLKPDPVDSTSLNSYVPALMHRVHGLSPERIVLIKATVYDAAHATLAAAGLPVSSVRVPFPGSGQQTNFSQAFAKAVRESEADTVATPEPALSSQRRFAFDLADWFEANAKQIGEDYDRYFTSFTGRWFEHFAAVGDPNRFDASDLVAVETLSVQVPPEVAAKLLLTEPDRFNALLRRIPRSVDIWGASRETLQDGPAAELHTLLRTLPGVDWVIAGKLLAAKRPLLIPILDNKITDLLQPPTSRFWISMWDELSDESRRTTVAQVCAGAPADVSLLRRIDVALWMAASQRGQ